MGAMKLSKRQRDLKAELGDRYSFEKNMSDNEVKRLQRDVPEFFTDSVVAKLVMGCVRIDAVLYKLGNILKLGYDVYLKDRPDSEEWIFFDTPNDVVKLNEHSMFFTLDNVVTDNDLSYTECNFESLNGKLVEPVDKGQAM